MTGYLAIDWAIAALSLFNIIVLLWLGLTVWLNSAPPGSLTRHRGVWLMSGGLLAGAMFFVCHIIILGQAAEMALDGLDFWWRVGWLPILIVPYIWYVVVLWYCGYWEHESGPLRSRHRLWGYGVTLSMALLILSTLVLQPLPPYSQVALFARVGEWPFQQTPIFFLLFPLVMVACVTLSIDALLRPAQGKYPITAHARQRSRPWLLATALVLLLVSLLVVYILARIANGDMSLRGIAQDALTRQMGFPLELARFDLLLSALLALASLLLGQAIVSYEIFTGRVLPRRTFFHHWRSVVILAAGYAAVVAWSLTVALRPIYSLLLTTLLMAIFYALYSWRTFLERERFIEQLRPFVQRRSATELSDPGAPISSLAADLFHGMCRDVLGTTHAQLIAQGSAALLAGPPLFYPPAPKARAAHAPTLEERDWTGAFDPARSDIIALQPSTASGYAWAIPLWSERDRIGTLLIAEKRDGGLYSQEEVEIAQATGERIITMLTGEQMTRRLMAIESKRVQQQRVNDMQMRRSLHDEILPMLHLAALRLNALQSVVTATHADHCAALQEGVQEALEALTAAHRQTASLLAERRATLGTTGWPADGLCNLSDALEALIAAEFSQAFDGVKWLHSEPVLLDGFVCEIVLGAAREVMRNAALHARGQDAQRPLHVSVCLRAGEALQLIIDDDGMGIAAATLSAGDTQQGSGSGLALHSTMLAIVGGSLAVEPRAGGGTRATIRLPYERAADGAASTPETSSSRAASPNGAQG